MTLVALALLIVAAFMHAGWNYYAKGARNDLALQLAYIILSAIAFLPLADGSAAIGDRGAASAHGLLCVNHEAIAAHMSFPGFARKGAREKATRETVAVEMEALGVSVVEVEKQGGRWHAVRGKRNRRVSGTTPVRISGPSSVRMSSSP